MFLVGCKIDEIRTDGDLSAFRRDLEKYAELGMKAVEVPVHGLDAIPKESWTESGCRRFWASCRISTLPTAFTLQSPKLDGLL